MSSNDHDVALVTAIAGGDRHALSTLYERYAPIALATAHRILGERREAEDILHDVFLEVWKKAADYDRARGTVRTWIMIRVRSRSLDRCKSAGRARAVPIEEARMAERSSSAQDPSMAPDRRAVRQALEALPEKQRAILRLAYFGGLSSSEIARKLDLPIGTVKSRAASGLALLRTGFAARGGDA